MADNANNTSSINQSLYDASLRGDVAALQDLLQRDPLLIYRSSTNTSLHSACKLGHLHFACELLRLNPNLSEELDPTDKSSPLHIASKNGHLELVKYLVSVNHGTCFSRDMFGMNPVHVAAAKGHLHVLNELLGVAPAAARERVGGGESILHLCVKYEKVKALKLVVSAVGDAEMLNIADGNGNTVMHVAVATKQLKIVRFLLGDGRVMKNAPNTKGLTSMDIFKQSHKDVNNDHHLKLTLKRFNVLQSEEIQNEKEKRKNRHFEWLENQRSALMVVASLIATMAFQAGLNPPGGVWQDTTISTNITNITANNQTAHTAGFPIMVQQSKDHYNNFLVLNTAGFVASMSSILLLISGLPCRRFFLVLIMVTMWVSITAMTTAYAVALFALTPEDDRKLVQHVILYSIFAWLFVMSLLLLGHLTWWTLRLLKQLGRLVMKLFRCCLPERRIAY